MCRDPHPRQRTQRVKRLREIQAPRRRVGMAHRQDVGVGRHFKQGEPAGQHAQGEQKKIELVIHTGRNKQRGADSGQRQAQQYPGLVGEAADKNGARQGHNPIPEVEGELHQAALGI